MRGPIINWLERRTGKNVDGSTLPPGTAVHLTSRFHRFDPQHYVIERLVPKPFWRFWGLEAVEVSRVDALSDADVASLGGRFRSDPVWLLPRPQNQAGVATFRASSDSGDVVSGPLSSGGLILEEMTTSGALSGELGADVPLPALNIGAKVGGSRTYEQRWRVRVADDPPVTMSLVQGEAALSHLRELERQVELELDMANHESMDDLPPDTLTYFVDTVAGDIDLRWQLLPEQPVVVSLAVPDALDLRAVACLRVESLEDGSVATSVPRFFTTVRDRLVVTDLTIEMLRHEQRDLLFALAEAGYDLDTLAADLARPVSEVWASLVEAAEELGASSVSDAALLAAESAPALA